MSDSDLKNYIEEQSNEKIIHYTSGMQALKDLTDLGNADENTSQDYAGRFAFELMQNGADAYQKASSRNPDRYPPGRGKIHFALAENYLIVANTGTPFSHKPDPGDRQDISSIESISRLGESTKKSGEYIGNKGIGFRSIYQICNRLWLISGGYQARYDGHHTYKEIHDHFVQQKNGGADKDKCLDYINRHKNKIPMLKVGFWFELDELPENVANVVTELQNDGYDTILVLERNDSDLSGDVDETFIWDRLASLSEKEILFLNTLCEVSCRSLNAPDKSFSFQLERQDDMRIVRKFPGLDKWEFLVFQFPIPELDQEDQKAQIAFQLDENKRPCPAGSADRVFYTFYPAIRENHGFPFFLHSYFMLSPNREYFNCEALSNIERNKKLLESLAEHLAVEVIPLLRERFPDIFLPDILMPSLNDVIKERLSEFGKQPSPTLEILSRQGALSAWFIREVLNRLSDEGLVRDLKNTFMPIKKLRRAPLDVPLSAQVADCLFKKLAKHAESERFPYGLTFQNRALLDALTDIERFFTGDVITLDTLAFAFENTSSDFTLTPDESGALIVLLSCLADSDSEALHMAVERIRRTKAPVLPCRGEENNQPLPQYPEKGKPVKASYDAPLVFYAPSQAEAGDDEIAVEEMEESAGKLDLPSFCHVHVLQDEVLSSLPEVDADRMRTILREQLGLRPFKPEDIFTRIAESTLSTIEEAKKLSTEQHRAFLEATIRLIERRRLRGKVQNRKYEFRPWYLKERADSDWRLYYFLSRSFIPMAGGWKQGNKVILAGALSSSGENIRQAYEDTDQVILSNDNETPWFIDLLNKYFDQYADTSELADIDIEFERMRFRRYVYLLLGAWDGLRFEVVNHPGGRWSDAGSATQNPYDFIDSDEWQEHCEDVRTEVCWSSYSLENCRLIQCAAIPYFDELTIDGQKRTMTIEGLQKALETIGKRKRAEILSPGNSPCGIPSFLSFQLQKFPWVESELRDQAIPDDAPIWFTRQDIAPKTHDRQSAHYLRSVTARQISEPLARVIGMSVLEDAAQDQLPDFVELYSVLCKRIGKEPAPGPGFLTLYQFVVSRIQQILLGKERPSSDHISDVRESKQEWLEKIREVGIITINDHEAGPELCSDIAGVFYDDTGAQNPIFRRFLSMAAFDDTSQGFARMIGINLLSNADIRYDDGKDDTFEGHEDIENEIGHKLSKLRAPLFAFRAFAAFIPEAQRLKVGEETYNRRWKMFKELKVEVVPILRISIGGKPPNKIPPEFPVVLEHESQARRHKRLFIQESTLSSDNEVPLRILARPLAVALGAEAQTIAVEMLLTQYNDGLDSVYTYLSEQCGVTRDQVHEIEELDEIFVAERKNQARVLEEKIINSILRCYPQYQLDENEINELREKLSRSLSVNSPALLDFLQNRLRISLNVVSEALGIKKITSNIHNFNAKKELYKQKLLLMVARKKGIKSPGEDWGEIYDSYNDLNIPVELQYWWQPTDSDLIEPINLWLTEFNVHMPVDDGFMIISEKEQSLWDRLNPEKGHGAYDSKTNRALLNVFIPWVIALCKSSLALPVTDLLDALDEYGLEEIINDSEPFDEIRERLEDFLKKYYVSQAYVEALFRNWPEVSSQGTGLKIDFVEKVRSVIEQHRSKQQSRSKKLVKKYVKYINGLIAEKKIDMSPISVKFQESSEFEVKETPSTQSFDSRKSLPHKQRRNTVGEEDFVAANFRNRVVGECGENFVLEIQRLQWKSLSEAGSDKACKCLEELKKYYNFGKSVEGSEWRAKWGYLEKIDPSVWTQDKHWAVLRSLLYMAEWDTTAGYDVLCLFQDNGVDWQIKLVEVKATQGKHKLDFPITRNELKIAERNGDTYVIWRVLNVVSGRIPNYLLLTNPIRLISEGKIATMDMITILKPNVTIA